MDILETKESDALLIYFSFPFLVALFLCRTFHINLYFYVINRNIIILILPLTYVRVSCDDVLSYIFWIYISLFQ